MNDLAAQLPALRPEARQFIARLLKIDVDLLSVSAVDAAIMQAALRREAPAMKQRTECIHALLAGVIKSRIDLLGPLVSDDPTSPAA